MLVMGLPLQDRLSASQRQNQLGQSGGIVASTALDVKRLVSSAISLHVTLAASRFGDNISCWHLRQVKPSGRHWRLCEAPEKHRADVTYASVVTSATATIRFWSGLLPALPRR